MKVQLILTPLEDKSEIIDTWHMPLGLVSLANSIKDLADVEILGGDHLSLEEIIKRLCPGGITGISYTSLSARNVNPIATAAKNMGNFVVVGGQAATASPYDLFTLPGVDAVVVHDGEVPLRMLIERRLTGLSLIPNLYFRDGDNIQKTQVQDQDYPLDQFSPIYQRNLEGIDIDLYKSGVSSNSLLNITANSPINFVSQRGCVRRCSFCSRQDKKHISRDPKNVIAEIRHLQELGFDYVVDNCDTWAFNTEWVRNFSRQYTPEVGMMVFADIRDMNHETLEAMKRCGIDNVLYGVESGSEEILRQNFKAYSKRRIIDTIKHTTDARIKVSASFVLGLLGETSSTLEETEQVIDQLMQFEGVRSYANIIIPLPGSLLWAEFNSQSHQNSLEYDLDSVRRSYLENCTSINLDQLLDLRDRINTCSGLNPRQLEYAR